MRTKLSNLAQGLTLIMVSVLFFVWGVLGTRQVNSQTERILQSVHEDLVEANEVVVDNQKIIIASSDYISCLLHFRPEDRNPKVYHRCLRQSGLDDLRGKP